MMAGALESLEFESFMVDEGNRYTVGWSLRRGTCRTVLRGRWFNFNGTAVFGTGE